MMPRPALLLLRHATCTAPAGACLGQRDVPLDSAGTLAAQALADHWPAPLPRRVYCSDLRRARQTLAPLLAKDPVDVCYDARLRELSFGAWEGCHWDALHREQEAAFRHWGEHWLDSAPPGGESGNDLFHRVGDWHSEWLASGAPPALVVAHAGPLRALACLLNQLDPKHLFDIDLPHCAPWQSPAQSFDKARAWN
ncbi:histidine phosphatase family protein [Parahaliea aestuarii]|uniref:Alpha-ribazole phosphatase n=1 Tax=Parahaliea aestuarii TaxID=1852021 RepID=A0A5C8ZVP7_9GAMM|nr:histidine phosphatase family protein [Parahaliea aestuarii]TXS91537.1 alpha-ribazole phosphatase [Parahaliea aestuarii]